MQYQRAKERLARIKGPNFAKLERLGIGGVTRNDVREYLNDSPPPNLHHVVVSVRGHDPLLVPPATSGPGCSYFYHRDKASLKGTKYKILSSGTTPTDTIASHDVWSSLWRQLPANVPSARDLRDMARTAVARWAATRASVTMHRTSPSRRRRSYQTTPTYQK